MMKSELTQQEKLILDTVIEYLNKNRYFNMEQIIPFITARFKRSKANISKIGIEEGLKSLVRKNLIVEGSKLLKEDILIHEKRKKIYDYIIQNPGIYLNRLIKELNYSNNIIVWHVDMLLKFNLIKKEIVEKHEVYFERSLTFKEVLPKYIASKPKSKQILKFLNNNGGASKTKISEKLHMHNFTITKYLDDLEKHKYVSKKKEGRSVVYTRVRN